MGKLFGTDGVRGIANLELTAELAFKIGQAGAYVLTRHNYHKARILVGKDTRISGDMLESALVSGILSVGADAVLLGVVPTPTVAYLTKKYEADAGVVISASHNSVEYNGIKFFNSVGFKLNDSIEEEIESYILGEAKIKNLPVSCELGRKIIVDTAVDDYVEFIKSTCNTTFDGLKIAVDCANGASFKTSPMALRSLGAEVVEFYNQPDGTNINAGCGSTHVRKVQAKVKEIGADIGLAFDGDADRLIAVDEKGNVVDGDKIMAILANYLKGTGELTKNTLVATVMSNLGLMIAMEKLGINVVQAKVGDRYVLEEMLSSGYMLGGEQSGHIIFLQHNTTGDGLLTAVHLVSVIKQTGKKLSELADIVKILPQVLINARVDNVYKPSFMNDNAVKEMIEGLEKKYNGCGRILIRPSGTEPLVRIMIEGEDKVEMEQDAKALAVMVESKFA